MQEIVKSIIQKDNRYLLIKRSPNSTFFAELWDFPGGKLDQNETLEQGVCRETKEETSYNVKVIEKLGDYLYNENNWPIHFNVFLVKIVSGNLKLSQDHTEYDWVTKENLTCMKLTPIVKLFFDMK